MNRHILHFVKWPMDIRTGRHVVFMIHAHLVFTTKKRGKVLSSQHLDRLKEIFAAICVDFGREAKARAEREAAAKAAEEARIQAEQKSGACRSQKARGRRAPRQGGRGGAVRQDGSGREEGC